MSNPIWININIMEMNRHMLIFFFISLLQGREKEWASYQKNNEAIRLRNEIGMNCL
jgi:hypothetical protein